MKNLTDFSKNVSLKHNKSVREIKTGKNDKINNLIDHVSNCCTFLPISSRHLMAMLAFCSSTSPIICTSSMIMSCNWIISSTLASQPR